MRLSQAIEMADRMRPNVLLKEEKIIPLYKLETEIAQIMGEEAPEWDTTAEDPELLAPDEHFMLYPYTLLPYIDHYQEETDLYQIDMITANQALADFRAQWARTHRHADTTQIKGVFI